MAATERWREATALFDEMVELEPGERNARLAALATRDAPLARAVQELLAADARSGVLDAGVAHASPTLAGALAQPADAADESGATLGPFRLVRLLGRGGMGEVYLAERSVGDMRQLVAVKLLKRGMDSMELTRRFAQERRILAHLSHPHIARFLDGGLAPDGRPYYAMEYVEGRDIVRHANDAGLDLRARIALLAEVCDAVAYAHTQLVVHRDLKPSNVLVDANGQPRVLDFGIAKLLGDDADGTLTGTGARVMSPAYAAPEQILGEPAGTTTDVYALGVVLFELLTGALPHRRSGSPEALARALETESIGRPSEVARTQPGRRARELSGDLDTIALMALRREPARRYATAAALADDLRRWLDGRPVAARPDTVRYRTAKFVRRHRTGVAAAALVLAALVAGLGVALWQAGIAREQARRADAEAQRAEREAALAKESLERGKRVKEFLISVFLQEDPLRRDARGALTMAQAFEDAKSRIDTELADDPKLRTDLLDDFGEITAGKGDFVGAKKLFERSLALAEQAYGPSHPAVAESLINLSVIAAYQGDGIAGEPLLERAVAILEPYAASEPFGLASALSALASVRREKGRLADAVALLTRVLAIERAARKPGDPPISALENLATALIDVNRTDEAERYIREAMTAIEASSGAQSPQMMPALWSLETLLFRQGRFDEERAATERRVAIARAAFPGDHPWTAAALAELGEEQARAGEAGGEARIAEALAMFARIGREDVRALGMLAHVQARATHHVEALETAARAAAECARENAGANKACLGVRALHAEMLARTGRAAEGLAEADTVLADIARAYSMPVGEKADAQVARAVALAALGRRADAIVAQREAIAVLQQIYVPGHAMIRRLEATLGELEAAAANG